jgi:hypothetical protein
MKAACHCQNVQFEVDLSDGLNTARRCNCSLCRMRGAVAVSVPLNGIRFSAGEDRLTLYQFNTNTAKHYFCSVCGVYTHHQRRSNPNQYGVNVACLEGVSPFDFEEVKVMNGSNHPVDGQSKIGEVVGVLKFETSSSVLAAARSLYDIASPDSSESNSIERLAEKIDRYLAVSWKLQSEEILPIQNTDAEPPARSSYTERRARISNRWGNLGLYWVALDSMLDEKSNGDIGVGDAIDDLLDICGELQDVFWFQEHFGEQEALAALKFAHSSHLYMHLLPLRSHLEDRLRKG